MRREISRKFFIMMFRAAVSSGKVLHQIFFQRINTCGQIENKIIKNITVNDAFLSHWGKQFINRYAQNMEHFAQRFFFSQSADIVHTDRTINSRTAVRTHQTAGQRIFFHNRYAEIQKRQKNTRAQSADSGTDDNNIFPSMGFLIFSVLGLFIVVIHLPEVNRKCFIPFVPPKKDLYNNYRIALITYSNS